MSVKDSSVAQTGQAPAIGNNLGKLRAQRGFSAIQLAGMVGVSRQTIHAMEAGSYVPNTAVALKLARALDARVEDLFMLSDDLQPPELHSRQAVLLPGCDAPQPGQPLQLCRVDKRLIASAPSPVRWYFPAVDGIAEGRAKTRGKTEVQVFGGEEEFGNKLLVAGCDPGISVLARHVQRAGIELVLAHRNSSQSLELLKAGCVHIAGTHLKDEASGESNLPEISRRFSKNAVAVVSFAVWEEGIVITRGNPKNIRGVEDFARADVSIVNRENGSGSRNLLDARLDLLGIDGRSVRGYQNIAPGHLPAAWQVQSGAADCCIATRAAARVFGLAFRPLVSERYDLAIRRQHLALPAVQNVLDALNRSRFRRELESLGGYDTTTAGTRML